MSGLQWLCQVSAYLTNELMEYELPVFYINYSRFWNRLDASVKRLETFFLFFCWDTISLVYFLSTIYRIIENSAWLNLVSCSRFCKCEGWSWNLVHFGWPVYTTHSAVMASLAVHGHVGLCSGVDLAHLLLVWFFVL